MFEMVDLVARKRVELRSMSIAIPPGFNPSVSIRMPVKRRVANSAGSSGGQRAVMWDAQLPDGEMIRGLACGYRCSSWRWSTTATTSAFGLSRVNADPRRLWSTRANVCEGNGLKPTSSVRVNSSSWVSLKPERLRAYKFSSRSFRSARSTWIRGTVGFLWTTDWIQANAIELAMESRSVYQKEIRVLIFKQ